MNRMVDVSAWQGKISLADWEKVKKTADQAIIRASYTNLKKFCLNADSVFSNNMKTAIEAGLKVGAYHYSQAISVSEAKKEAKYLVKQLTAFKENISLPVVCDWEFGGRLSSSKAKALGKDKCTKIVSAFCDTIQAAGYEPMVYANLSTFRNYLNYSTLRDKYDIWLAQYSNTASITDYDYWQYTSSGTVDGISGRVDLSFVGKSEAATNEEKSCYTGALTNKIPAADAISSEAEKLSWSLGTNKKYWKYSYDKSKKFTAWKQLGTARPTVSFREAIDRVYGKHWLWGSEKNGYGPRVGASCDVGVGTVVRNSEFDSAFPRGLSGQWPHCEKSSKWTDIKGTGKLSQLKKGDIVQYNKTGGGGHIYIYLGNKIMAQAGLCNCFLHKQKISSYYYKLSGKDKIYIHRPTGTGRNYLRFGDVSSSITKWQNFLNWYFGKTVCTPDGEFGEITLKYTKKFQTAQGLESDGEVGTKTITKAKAVKK